MAHTIMVVAPNSLAAQGGIAKGDRLLQINGEEVIDQIDYQALSTQARLELLIEKADGRQERIQIIKDEYEPLGLQIEDTLMSKPRQCANNCIFCFIDQMPPNLRGSLYVKDDDWRLSLMMGNYVTLTNVSQKELDRIIARKASPLYISIHATDGDIRKEMMRNQQADQIMPRLQKLTEAGIRFHAQIVLCPGVNDGKVLENTLKDLLSFYPAAQSAALVPVGLTAFREGLYAIKPYNRQMAAALINQVEPIQQKLLDEIGTRFVFVADEFFSLAAKDMPGVGYYEDFGQIENGVGLVRMFMDQLEFLAQEGPLEDVKDYTRVKDVVIPCGTSIAPYFKQLVQIYAAPGVNVQILPVINHFFGPTITVTGLITGGDLLNQLKCSQEEAVCICRNMLRAEGDLFLDGMGLDEIRKKLSPKKVYVVENDGEAFYKLLQGYVKSEL